MKMIKDKDFKSFHTELRELQTPAILPNDERNAGHLQLSPWHKGH